MERDYLIEFLQSLRSKVARTYCNSKRTHLSRSTTHVSVEAHDLRAGGPRK